MVQGSKKGNVNRILAICLLVAFACRAAAQNDHYWAQQYGAESSLLGGAAVAGVDDNSASYYNPAAIGFINNPSLSLDANVYKMDKIRIHNGGGNGVNLNSAQISIYPQIIAGMIPVFKESRFRFSYSILTRNHANILVSTRFTGPDPWADPSSLAASGRYVAIYDYLNQLNEQWFGFTAAYRSSDHFSAGITFLSSYRGQTYEYANSVQQIDTAGAYDALKLNESLKTSNFRILLKMGISYQAGHVKCGVTVTTPSVGMYGKGNIEREHTRIALPENEASDFQNYFISDRKTDVSASYRHPLSVAFGFEYHDSKTRVLMSSEYFFGIQRYEVVNPETDPLIYGDIIPDADYRHYLKTESQSKPVLNIGVGVSQHVFGPFSLLAGAYTDFSCYENTGENGSIHGYENVNLYHIATGLTYHKLKQAITLGFTYAFTPDEVVPHYASIKPVTGDAVLSSHSYAVVLGYTYYLAKYAE
jgi:hypothetical protein